MIDKKDKWYKTIVTKDRIILFFFLLLISFDLDMMFLPFLPFFFKFNVSHRIHCEYIH